MNVNYKMNANYIQAKFMEKDKDCQVVMRITKELSDKIKAAAASKGLTAASWLRQLAIESLNTYKIDYNPYPSKGKIGNE